MATLIINQYNNKIDLSDLGLDSVLTECLQDRVGEKQNCPKDKVALGAIFLFASTLEGILLALAIKSPAKFMSAKAAESENTLKFFAMELLQISDSFTSNLTLNSSSFVMHPASDYQRA